MKRSFVVVDEFDLSARFSILVQPFFIFLMNGQVRNKQAFMLFFFSFCPFQKTSDLHIKSGDRIVADLDPFAKGHLCENSAADSVQVVVRIQMIHASRPPCCFIVGLPQQAHLSHLTIVKKGIFYTVVR